MDYFLHFVYTTALYVLIPIYLVVLLIRAKWHKVVIYRYPLAGLLAKNKISTQHPYRKIFFLLRALALLLLAFLIAKPQLVDSNSKVNVEGIDIVLSIDVSGSMRNLDNKDDQRSRLDIAKAEAIRLFKSVIMMR
jgi:Ca-activated chloride channel family protein